MQDPDNAAQPGEAVVVVPVIEEQLQVRKQIVDTGGVRVVKRVLEREELIDEPLLREDVEVERVVINRVIDQPVAARQEGDTLIIPLVEEVLVVEKRLVLREELRVRKRRSEVHRPQRVVLRSEEVTVQEQLTNDEDKGGPR